jgi:26S proteasome regulatory subunit N5
LGRVLVSIVRKCFEAKQWDLLNDNITQLSKRRGQLKQALTKMVQEGCTYVDQMPDQPSKLKLIETLRAVTAGKVSEFETRILYLVYEDSDRVDAYLLQHIFGHFLHRHTNWFLILFES